MSLIQPLTSSSVTTHFWSNTKSGRSPILFKNKLWKCPIWDQSQVPLAYSSRQAMYHTWSAPINYSMLKNYFQVFMYHNWTSVLKHWPQAWGSNLFKKLGYWIEKVQTWIIKIWKCYIQKLICRMCATCPCNICEVNLYITIQSSRLIHLIESRYSFSLYGPICFLFTSWIGISHTYCTLLLWSKYYLYIAGHINVQYNIGYIYDVSAFLKSITLYPSKLWIFHSDTIHTGKENSGSV